MVTWVVNTTEQHVLCKEHVIMSAAQGHVLLKCPFAHAPAMESKCNIRQTSNRTSITQQRCLCCPQADVPTVLLAKQARSISAILLCDAHKHAWVRRFQLHFGSLPDQLKASSGIHLLANSYQLGRQAGQWKLSLGQLQQQA